MTKYFGGLDEVCKGEVLSNLVICLVYTTTNLSEIPYVGESKKRKIKGLDLKTFLKKYQIRHKIFEWPPKYLDKYNLNFLIYKAHQYLLKKIKINRLYVDNFVHHTKVNRLKKKYLQNVDEIFLESKMDERNSLVGLASILASQRKKQNLKNLESQVKEAVGSGNISDPVTKQYLIKNYPKIKGFRYSWKVSYLKSHTPILKKEKIFL